jgi:hypothetical protein
MIGQSESRSRLLRWWDSRTETVWVMQVRDNKGRAYTSVHRSSTGAHRRLHKIIGLWGMDDEFIRDELDWFVAQMPVIDN